MKKKRIVGEEKQVCSSFLKSIENNMGSFIEEMQMEEIEKAAEIILDAESNGRRVHISGIGKPAHLAGYIASLFSSTGTPAYFLHGTEAVHLALRANVSGRHPDFYIEQRRDRRDEGGCLGG